MKILITGNMAYVGSVLVPHLASAYPEATLIGFDNGYFGHCLTSHAPLPEKNLACQYFGDTRTIDPGILDGVDAVVYLAAVSNDPMGVRFEAVTHDINVAASMRLAEIARARGIKRFVFASSCSVYGFASDGARTESDATDPLTAYAKSKVAMEKALAPIAGPEMQVTCLRFATACGFSPRLRLDLVLNDFVASALATGAVTVLSDGSPWRPLIHVADMARAIEWALQRESAAGGDMLIVNAGSDQWNYQVRDLALAVNDAIPGTKVSINTDAQPDRRSYRVNFELFRSLAPGHQPRVTLRSAIDGLATGLRDIGFGDTDFRNSDLIRLRALGRLIDAGTLSNDLAWQSATAHINR